MSKRAGALALAMGALVLALAGCGQQKTPTINASMTQIMQPEAQTVWDITSRAFNAKGDGLDASKLKPTDWIKLAKAGRKLRDRAAILAANARTIEVRGLDDKILGEDASHAGVRQTYEAASPRQVKAYIDANPDLFAQRARVLEKAGDDLLNAAHTYDIKTVYEVSSNFDEVCDGCHEKFWGTDEPPPFQPAPGEQAGKWIKIQ